MDADQFLETFELGINEDPYYSVQETKRAMIEFAKLQTKSALEIVEIGNKTINELLEEIK